MTSTFTIDLTSISAQLTALIKSCMDTARDSVKAAADQEHALSTKTEGSDIEGLREQILANATILLPLLRPDVIDQVTTNGLTPKLHVIVSGQPDGDKLFLRAYVVHGQDASHYKVKFLYTDANEPSASAAQALQKLLDVSAQLVETHVFGSNNVVEGQPEAVTGGGWCSVGGNSSPIIEPEDLRWWGKKLSGVESTPNTSFSSDSGYSTASTQYSFGAGNIRREDSGVGLSSFSSNGSARF